MPYGPINNTEAVFDDPQVKARQLAINLPHPQVGSVPGVGSPIRMSETPATYHTAPPSLGADTMNILQSRLGLSEQECETLVDDGICNVVSPNAIAR